jgi:hypothetical protein
MSEPLYGEINDILIDNEIFQVQRAEFEDETVFVLKRNGEIFCIIMQDENNEWKPDCEMNEAQFTQAMHWIRKLYPEE